jgi:ubiquinone/menaquinone biosynthesis C-methylase UbiE
LGLVDLDLIESLLVCPRCRSVLARSANGFRCSSPACALAAEGSFPRVERWPVLVDFEASILDRETSTRAAGANPVEHRWSIGRLPAWLRPLWKPRNAAAARNVDALLARLPAPSPVVLVIGGGTVGNGVEALYADRRIRLVAFDIYGSPLTQFVADAHQIPLASESVDAVVIQAVLEHVLDPERVVGEIHRVLRPGGLVYAETPFLQPVHAGPYDFTRYTVSGHRHLFRSFEEIDAGVVAGPGAQLLASVEHVVRGLLRSELAGKLARATFFWMRYLDRVIPTTYAMDSASAYFFLGRRSERRLSADEIVAYYRGAQHR